MLIMVSFHFLQVLEGFLASSKIYCTEMFHYQYEKKARQNIMKELKSLH